MALIKCPKCQGQISSRATTCAHCGIVIEEYLKEQAMLSFIEEERRKHIIICPECQGEAYNDDEICPHCGFPVGDKEAVALAEEELRVKTERILRNAKMERAREQQEKIAELSVPTSVWSYLLYLILGMFLLGAVCFGLKYKIPIVAIVVLLGFALIFLWQATMYFHDEKKRKTFLEKVIADSDFYANKEKRKATECERLNEEMPYSSDARIWSSNSISQHRKEKKRTQDNYSAVVVLLSIGIVLTIMTTVIAFIAHNSEGGFPDNSDNATAQVQNTEPMIKAENTSTQNERTTTSCNHNWQGNIQAGFIMCSKCDKVLSTDEIKAKKGIGLSPVEKARIYWSLDSNLTARKKDGKYLYSEDEAFSLVEKDYGVTKDYLKNNIWNGHAYDDYVKYYITAWKSNSTTKSTTTYTSGGSYQTVSSKDDKFWYAVSAAQELVKGKLTSPSSAKFPWSGDSYAVSRSGNSYKVSGYVDAQNSYGTSIRVTWAASFTMGDTSGSNYQVTNCEVTLYD
ncbi:MAG: hypothetical protein ACI3W5_04965 [Faecousia sp.]